MILGLKPGQILILDNAGFYKSADSKKLIEAARRKQMVFPLHFSGLNLIEKYWANMKIKVGEFGLEYQPR